MRFAKVLVAVILILLCSCSSAKGAKVMPVTDGLNCIVRAKGENVEQVLSIKRNGETYEAIFQHDDGSRGMGMTVSPNGCAIEIFGLLKKIDFDYV